MCTHVVYEYTHTRRTVVCRRIY